MASGLVNRVQIALQRFDNIIVNILSRRFPPEALCVVELNEGQNWPQPIPRRSPFSIENIIDNGFLWGVPTHKRTIEKRWKRRFGNPKYISKLLSPKTNILTCHTCGHDHEAGILCRHCYDKVMGETKEMQTAIVNDLGLNPVEKDVIVLYDGEKSEEMVDYWKNKKIVEVPRKRPNWFQKNLLQRTTEVPSDSKEVEPTHLA
ncbi:large ribosomal subunit protein bL32m [Neodiprion pinetum]|uniref:Large ribosomal subunit protein bL32m n=1 Tax=Neodiprion lecontei TaxID=441921 RepID=A0A6J0C7T6_NEOLC|nr:39S ribosomal protein L32, mitochondrial [Neodiprion lecontei]XP_046435769.1 39S ribosomal protein L32, mitochondrial [Neodiprion fabricii]XP_046467146.1 39S ribosomal protein L32, mitochondrial [Neodiprion pinetum]XP_046605929.1 39S ribosomal protein L32, mitochondrial [Neodiprion virginianus]